MMSRTSIAKADLRRLVLAATVLMAIARRTAGTAVDAAEGLAVVAEIEDAVVVADVRVVAADGIVADAAARAGEDTRASLRRIHADS
jgi:hypothetical protein